MDTCHRRRAIDINELLDAFGLPSSAPFTESRVLELLQSDKKRVAGRQRYVLPAEPGGVEIRDDVPDSLVRSALATINAAAAVV